jgi:hypothetical protein
MFHFEIQTQRSFGTGLWGAGGSILGSREQQQKTLKDESVLLQCHISGIRPGSSCCSAVHLVQLTHQHAHVFIKTVKQCPTVTLEKVNESVLLSKSTGE